jgi:hypothetical protein
MQQWRLAVQVEEGHAGAKEGWRLVALLAAEYREKERTRKNTGRKRLQLCKIATVACGGP